MKHIIRLTALAAFAFMLVLAGCSSVREIKTDQAPGFSIGKYKTFDFYQTDVTGETVPGFDTRVQWIKNEIAKQLTAKGLTQSSTDPDLLVNVGINIEEKIQTRETDIRTDGMRYTGQRNYSWQSQEVEVGRYKDGTIKVDLVDRASGQQVWQGTAASVLVKNDQSSKKNIAAGGEKMFAKMQ